MIKNVHICSDDPRYRNYIEKAVKELQPEAEVIHCENQCVLYNSIMKISELYIICDQYFLGLSISLKRDFIKTYLNESARILVTAWDAYGDYFGVRIKNLNFDGFINHIGIGDNLKNGLKEFLDNGKYFDAKVEEDYLNKTLYNYAKRVTDVRQDEIQTVLFVRKNGYAKNGKPDSGEYKKISDFKMKIGVDSDFEMDSVIQRFSSGTMF